MTPAAARPARRYWIPGVLFLAVLIFYWSPLTAPGASIQWDAVDVHYTSQKYFADHVRAGQLPHWTPYIFSGFPFLADPQAGAWYPLNWPFFLLGITPGAIQLEIALHALLACAGAYLLAESLVGNATASLVAAFSYGFSGFFAGHSSHVGMFQAAAWFPWVLLGFRRSLEGSRSPLLLAGLGAGVLTLAGHFQTALYAFSGLALFAAAEAWRRPKQRVRIAVHLAAIVAMAALVSAIQTAPALELTVNSIRAGLNTSSSREGALSPAALLTLIFPDSLGAQSMHYHGPGDITQYYFYGGILLLPLAAIGLGTSAIRIYPLLLVVPSLWYAFGPSAGFYRLVAWLPGFRSVRAPVHVWFVIALGLALLAAAGARQVATWLPARYVAAGLVALVFADLLYGNSIGNLLPYARSSYQDRYGSKQDEFERRLAGAPALTRFHSPRSYPAFGPLNHPLDVRIETTYGYNPLQLTRYAAYFAAIESNSRLMNGLGVSRSLNPRNGAVEPNASALPRVSFPRRIRRARDAAAAAAMLAQLDPAEETVVTDGDIPAPASGMVSAEVVQSDEQSYHIRYSSPAQELLRVSVPFFPGWQAEVDGKPCRVVPADYALLGVIVPAGQHGLVVRFHSTYFAWGAGISLTTLLALAAASARDRFSGAWERSATI